MSFTSRILGKRRELYIECLDEESRDRESILEIDFSPIAKTIGDEAVEKWRNDLYNDARQRCKEKIGAIDSTISKAMSEAIKAKTDLEAGGHHGKVIERRERRIEALYKATKRTRDSINDKYSVARGTMDLLFTGGEDKKTLGRMHYYHKIVKRFIEQEMPSIHSMRISQIRDCLETSLGHIDDWFETPRDTIKVSREVDRLYLSIGTETDKFFDNAVSLMNDAVALLVRLYCDYLTEPKLYLEHREALMRKLLDTIEIRRSLFSRRVEELVRVSALRREAMNRLVKELAEANDKDPREIIIKPLAEEIVEEKIEVVKEKIEVVKEKIEVVEEKIEVVSE